MNADAPDVEVEFVEVRDEVVNPLGVKGCGEIGQVGAAAALVVPQRGMKGLPVNTTFSSASLSGTDIALPNSKK